jgi:iron complex outermembrane receptor protein
VTWKPFGAALAVALVLASGVRGAEDAAAPADKTPAPSPSPSPSPAPLATTLEERVVVSGQVAKERQDPASFTDLDRDAITWSNQGQDLSVFLGESMNAYAYSDAGNGYGYGYLRIRGFDQSRIAVNINGVPLNTPESHQVYTIDLGDFAGGLDRIQIQRGPGTSLYGSPAVGGVVNLETAPLATTAGGQVDAAYGSFGTSRFMFRYGGPVGTTHWAWMVRAAHVQSDGYRIPSWSRQTYLHLAFERFDPGSIWRIEMFGGPERTQLSYLGIPFEDLSDSYLRRLNTALQPGETDNFVQPQLQVINSRRIKDGLFLDNTWYAILGNGSYRQFSAVLPYDPLGSLPPTSQYPEATIENAWLDRALANRQVGWIPRVTWNHPGGQLMGGLELLFHRGRHRGEVTQGDECTDASCTGTTPVVGHPALYDFTNGKDTTNLFVREALRVAPTATLNLELQASRHRFTMRQDEVRGISWDATYKFLTPRVGVNWNVTDRWNVYAQAVKTESEPPFENVWNPEDPTDDPATHFDRYDPALNRWSDPTARPERLVSTEAGAGYRYGATHAKLNLYRMDFRDELVYAGGIDRDGVPLTTNAGRSIHQGIEIDAGGRIPGEVDLSGYLAVSSDVLKEYTIYSPLAAGGVATIDYSGNRIALFPDSLARLAVGRQFGPVRTELSARRIGRIYLDNSQDERKTPANRDVPGYVPKTIDPYTLVAAQAVADLSRFLGNKSRSLSLRLRVDNVLDAKVAQFGYSYPVDDAYTQFTSEFFPAATRSVMGGVTFGF